MWVTSATNDEPCCQDSLVRKSAVRNHPRSVSVAHRTVAGDVFSTFSQRCSAHHRAPETEPHDEPGGQNGRIVDRMSVSAAGDDAHGEDAQGGVVGARRAQHR